MFIALENRRVELVNFQLVPPENEERTLSQAGLDPLHAHLLKGIKGAANLVVKSQVDAALHVAHKLTGRK